LLVGIVLISPCLADLPFPLNARRILFLGDSITNDGRYISWIETQLRLQGVEPLPELVNLGLSSKTCSGLSERAHACPRPDVYERLDRALTKIRPDVVVSCYGMNDGIYHPFSQGRFEAYQKGVNRLIETVHAAKAKLILLTPPPFDALPVRGKGRLKKAGADEYGYTAMYENYDDVLARFSTWIVAQGERVEGIVDVRTALVDHVALQRKQTPQFTLSPDGVHPNAEGHRLLGEAILRAWQVVSTTTPGDNLLELAYQRAGLLHYAWLSEVGHRRPGVQPGLPLEEAKAQARR